MNFSFEFKFCLDNWKITNNNKKKTVNDCNEQIGKQKEEQSLCCCQSIKTSHLGLFFIVAQF